MASGYTAGLKITWEVSLLFSSLEKAAGVFSSFTTAKDREDSLVHLGPYLAPRTEQFRGDGRRSCGKAPRRLTRDAREAFPDSRRGRKAPGALAQDLQLCSLCGNTC